MLDHEETILRALEQASKLDNVVWRWWVYTAEANVLVLCAYRPPFDPLAYLAFRAPRRMRLIDMFAGARFRLIGGVIDHARQQTGYDEKRHPAYEVLIEAEGQTYAIRCGSVAYYRLDEVEDA